MKRTTETLGLLALAGLVAGCGSGNGADTDTSSSSEGDGDLVSFGASDCTLGGGGGLIHGLLTPVDGEDHANLFCVSWEAGTDDTIEIDVLNAWENCAGPFAGSAEVEDPHSLTLEYRKSDCSEEAGCDCTYEFSFAAKGVATDEDLALEVDHRQCDGSVGCVASLVLPLASKPAGVTCRYDEYMTQLAGAENAPCAPPEDGGPGGTCASDFVCTEIDGLDFPVCLAPCEATTDCPAPDVQECSDNVCKLAAPLPATCGQ
jgi:hypothetical protein